MQNMDVETKKTRIYSKMRLFRALKQKVKNLTPDGLVYL
jgi:hypothetical protein